MKCECCPLSNREDVCPEAEGKYGIESKDGLLGCTHPWNWIKKRDEDWCEYLGEMGLDMGIEMQLTEQELNRALEICKHMVGLDCKRPYHRHGQAYYKAYRNYYEDTLSGNAILEKLPKGLVRSIPGELSTWYVLTDDGLAWLGRQLHITIFSHVRNRRSSDEQTDNTK